MSEDNGVQHAGIGVNIATRRPPLAGLSLSSKSIRALLHDSKVAGDFRGTCLNGVDLTNLDLSGCQFGPDAGDASSSDLHIYRTLAIGAQFSRCNLTNANFRDADLTRSNLEGAIVQGATFTRADLHGAFIGSIRVENGEFAGARLDEVDLSDAVLLGVNMSGAYLSNADLGGADLRDADLYDADLGGTFLGKALMTDANLCDAHGEHALLPGAILTRAKMSGTNLPYIVLRKAVLDHAHLDHSHLRGADLSDASAQGSSLRGVVLTDATCRNANFSDANLQGAHLQGADLRGVTFSGDTMLGGALFDGAILHGARWRGVDVSASDLKDVKRIGDEKLARMAPIAQRAAYYRRASEAYAGLSSALQGSSLSRASISCHFRAAVMDRQAALYDFLTSTIFMTPQEAVAEDTRIQKPEHLPIGMRIGRFLMSPLYFMRWFGALILGLIAGYGDRPWRALASYVAVLTSFALSYFIAGSITGHSLTPLASLILSVTSFHGRGFNSTNLRLDSPLAAMSAIEAAIGAFIELLFVAAFTRRFIGTRG